MDEETSQRLCSGCLSANRFLEPLREHIGLYLTLLGEYMYDTNKTDNTVLCWECKALLRRACFFQKRIQHSQLVLHSLLPVKNHDTKLSRLSLTHVTVNSYSAEGVTNTLEIPLFKVNKNDNDVREESNSEVTVKVECISESDNKEHCEVLYEVFETSNDILPKQETVDNEHYEAFDTSNDNLPKQEAVDNENYEVLYEAFETSNDNLPKQETVENEHYEAFDTSNDNLPKQEAVDNENYEVLYEAFETSNDNLPKQETVENEEEVNSNKFNIDKEKLININVEKSKPINYETNKHKTSKATNDTKASNKKLLSCIEYCEKSKDRVRMKTILNLDRLEDYYRDFNLQDLMIEPANKACKINAKFECKSCKKSFNSFHKLKHHKISKHPMVRFKCLLCSVTFPSVKVIEEHIIESHAFLFLCVNCKETFNTLLHFNCHNFKNHPHFICGYCGMLKKYKSALEEHIRNMHMMPKCHRCKKLIKITRMKEHMRKEHPLSKEQEKEQAYCVECNKQYKSMKIYQHHLRYSAAHKTCKTEFFSIMEKNMDESQDKRNRKRKIDDTADDENKKRKEKLQKSRERCKRYRKKKMNEDAALVIGELTDADKEKREERLRYEREKKKKNEVAALNSKRYRDKIRNIKFTNTKYF